MLKSKIQKRKKGQSTVEYIILVAAVIGALIVFLKPGGVFQNAYKNALQQGTNGMEDMANRLSGSRGTPPG
jgi:hypothetical protein